MQRLTTALVLALAIGVGLFLNNSSLFSSRPPGATLILAHRGLSQSFDRDGLTGETCTAAKMLPPRHAYLENTLASMEAAFALGADVVEIDVHPTTDGEFAVFHDWTVDCRTEGTGVTREHSMAELRQLDAGYGYTADGGATFPFRGAGVGLIPTLDEVVERFADKRFHINVKSNDPAEGEALARWLAARPAEARQNFAIIGGDDPLRAVEAALPGMRTQSRKALTRCVPLYLLLGWSSFVPPQCHGTVLLIPINIAEKMWGWPNTLLDRMDAVDTQVYVLGAYSGGGFSQGFDDPALLNRLPSGYSGGISTDALDLLAPALRMR
jgi:glycerophosphoryl diester phosphodiesterase